MKFFFFFLTLFYTTLFYSQKNIDGFVLDSITKKPLNNVNVYLSNGSFGTITNSEGAFSLHIPKNNLNDKLIISILGYKSSYLFIHSYIPDSKIMLSEAVFELDEIIVTTNAKKINGDDVVKKAFNNYYKNSPEKPYLAKGFLRHLERNETNYKWLVEAATTMYDGGANKNPLQRKNDTIIMSVNEIRKSFDNRKIDSLFLYQGYLSDMNKSFRYFREKHRKRIQDSVSKKEFIRGIQYNDNRSSGLNMLFKGDKNLLNYVRFGHFKNSSNNKNIIRNYNNRHAIFDKNLFKKHSFNIDTILQQDERFIYKIKITPQKKMVALNIGLKKDYAPIGWLYIYKDNFAFKELSYSLIAITKDSKLGSKIFSNSSNIHYSINLKFIEHQEKMYLNYYSCSFPKMINAGITSKESDRFYYVKQEILFTHFIHDTVVISEYLKKPKNTNLFTKKPYNKQFWKNYTTLLETKEQKKLIEDLEKEVSLKEQFKQN